MKDRDGAKSENLGGQIVMQHTAAARQRLLFCQKLDGNCPPCSPASYAPEHIAKLEIVHIKLDKYVHTVRAPS